MEQAGARRALLLATVGFAIAFAVWGLLSGLAPMLKAKYGLTATQASLMVAIPVLLGSLGRLPAGLLADRLGPRKVLGTLLIVSCLPAYALAFVEGYSALPALGFFLGLAGTVFSVGVAYVSPWFSKEKQGTALGVFGVGTGGQSVAVFFGPVLARQFGIQAPFLLFGTLSLIWGVVMLTVAADPEHRKPPLSLTEALRPLRQPMCRLLSLFYFVTFGGFVALGIYLPSLLREVFRLEPADAGLRAAGFVVLATALRPIGGILSDRIGAPRVLAIAFGCLTVLALGLISNSMVPFTIAALGIAVCLGLGNGAVFKLVPEHFPQSVGAVTGLVGAAGGLGGFFPPLVLGVLKDRMGSYAPGFVALALTAALCLALTWQVLQRPARPPAAIAA
jgi:NNP family nitrate/nitrite transporter-like MFS transporter